MPSPDSSDQCHKSIYELQLKPGTLVVIRVPYQVTAQEADELRRSWREEFPQIPAVVAAAGVELDVRTRWQRLRDWVGVS